MIADMPTSRYFIIIPNVRTADMPPFLYIAKQECVRYNWSSLFSLKMIVYLVCLYKHWDKFRGGNELHIMQKNTGELFNNLIHLFGWTVGQLDIKYMCEAV